MYCTIEDIKQHISLDELARLSNDIEPTLINEDLVNNIISTNNDLINGYIRGRYPIDEVSANTILKNICVELTIVGLYERRNKVKLSENLIRTRDLQIQKLKSIQRGELTLETKNSEDRPKFFKVSSPEQIFKDKLYQDMNFNNG